MSNAPNTDVTRTRGFSASARLRAGARAGRRRGGVCASAADSRTASLRRPEPEEPANGTRLHRRSRSNAAREARRRTLDRASRRSARRRAEGGASSARSSIPAPSTRSSRAACRRWASSRSTSGAPRGSRPACRSTVASTTVDSQCGSSQQATTLAAGLIGSGLADVVRVVRRREHEPHSRSARTSPTRSSAVRCRRATSRATRSTASSRARS